MSFTKVTVFVFDALYNSIPVPEVPSDAQKNNWSLNTVKFETLSPSLLISNVITLAPEFDGET